MFGNLRVGTLVYVLYKNEPRIEQGEVQNVGIQYPQFGATYVGNTLQPQRMLVDIKVKVGDEVLDLQKLPADLSIADFGTNGMVISESKESILQEIDIIRKNSLSIIESIDHHKQVVESCDNMVESLNPSVKREAEQRKEIDTLKAQMADVSSDMADIKCMLSKLLNKSKKED